MLQSDETIWAKLLEFAAGCIEECIDATQFNAHRPALCNLSYTNLSRIRDRVLCTEME